MFLLKQKSFLIGLMLAVGLLSFTPQVSQGRGLVPCGGYADDQGTREKPCTFLDIFALIARVTNWLIAMSGIYAIYNIISNGFWLVLSQGNEESITTHKKGVTNAILGLCLVMIAFMIINFVINAILVSGMKGFKLDLTNPTCYLSPTTQNQCFVPATKQ